jgi:hypothetical protein
MTQEVITTEYTSNDILMAIEKDWNIWKAKFNWIGYPRYSEDGKLICSNGAGHMGISCKQGKYTA